MILGWVTGSVFFYASCYWLTYSMIHYGGLPVIVAYLLLIPGALIVGVFRNGLSLAGLDVLYQTLAVGVLIIVAVSVDQWIRKVKS